MIKINIKEGLKLPLPPATLKEIIQVGIWALLATSIIGGAVFGVYCILGRAMHWF